MNYYIVFFCNWITSSNAIVKSVELTTVNPTSFVKTGNAYVYLDLTAYLKTTGTKPYGNTVDAIMRTFTSKIGGLSVNDVPSTATQITMNNVEISGTTPDSRKLESWNDVVKPALIRAVHASSFGTL